MSRPSATSAGMWATAEAVAGQGINFVVSLILARILGPADFGVFAIAAFFSSLTIAAICGALSSALIQRQSTDIHVESSLFWFALAAASAVGAVLAYLASWLASYYGFASLKPLMFAVACQIILAALAIVPGSLLVRNLAFATLAKVALASALVPGFLAIGCAWAGLGIWSFAIQLVTAAFINAASLWRFSGWRPAFTFQIAMVSDLLRFSFWISLSGILETMYSQGAGLLIGKLYGLRNLGLFDRARSLNALPGNFLIGIIGRTALPLFTQSVNDRDAQRNGLRQASSVAMLLNLPAVAAFVAMPDLVIQALLGETWLSAAPVLRVLALSSVFLPVHAINLQLLLADGGARTYFRLEIAKKVIGIICILLGIGYGIVGLAWGYVAASVIALALNTWPTRRLIGYGIEAQLADLAGLFLCSVVMGIAMVLLRPFVFGSPPLALVTLLLVGGTLYLGAGLGLRLRSVREALQSVQEMYAERGNQNVSAPER